MSIKMGGGGSQYVPPAPTPPPANPAVVADPQNLAAYGNAQKRRGLGFGSTIMTGANMSSAPTASKTLTGQ